MKLPLLLLALAALLSWAALRFEMMGAAGPELVTATRAARPATPPAGRQPNSQSTRAIPPAPPLFRAARPISNQAQPGERLALIGLAGGAEARVAFLRDEADGRTFTARIGEQVRNWTLEETNERCVVLRRARRRENVCLS